MSFLKRPIPIKEFYTIKFKGKNLKNGEDVYGTGYCEAWNWEDCIQQAIEPKYWSEEDIFWGNADIVSDIEPIQILKEDTSQQ